MWVEGAIMMAHCKPFAHRTILLLSLCPQPNQAPRHHPQHSLAYQQHPQDLILLSECLPREDETQ
jgi:hypothetical protein